jgi:hypothetical protein
MSTNETVHCLNNIDSPPSVGGRRPFVDTAFTNNSNLTFILLFLCLSSKILTYLLYLKLKRMRYGRFSESLS